MPTYEYRCQSCGTRFEVWQKMSDDALTTCQACGGPVRRVIYPAGIVFKGGGFYSTDHHSNGASANGGASADGAHAADGAKGSAAAADAKSDAKAPAAPSSGSSAPTSSSNSTSSSSGS